MYGEKEVRTNPTGPTQPVASETKDYDINIYTYNEQINYHQHQEHLFPSYSERGVVQAAESCLMESQDLR